MEYFVIPVIAFLISVLSLFSGFGLGTVLMPVFALFFPVPLAISLTAVVHFLNNFFKLFLLAGNINRDVFLKFGVSSVIGALAGAGVLALIARYDFVISYYFLGQTFNVRLVNFVVGLIILAVVLLEGLNKLTLKSKCLISGGAISGFFGGLSGNQGAFRSVFLLKVLPEKSQYIATGVALACVVDSVRLSVYSAFFLKNIERSSLPLLIIVVISSFIGTYIARRYLCKVTIESIRIIVLFLLVLISCGLITGLIK